MSKQNLGTLSIKNLDALQELDDKTAEAVRGGIDYICMWPEDPGGTYSPIGVGSGIPPISQGTWHYYNDAWYTWVNTGYTCYPIGTGFSA